MAKKKKDTKGFKGVTGKKEVDKKNPFKKDKKSEGKAKKNPFEVKEKDKKDKKKNPFAKKKK
jgi:hypothetical protein